MSSVLEDKDAIREVLAAYCFHFDSGAFDLWLTLFTADGAFDLGPRGRFSGHQALANFVKAIPLTNGQPMMRHCVMNSIVSVQGEHATARSYVVVVHGITLAGRYEDQLAKTDGVWRFTERKVHFDLISGR